ncbi:MAG: MarR family transcriptional regulator [Candidatus Nitrosothermus koennekii]|nr:MAG: MarR family transcriptional regulator [Candidatus Nitrosothermus koennekii]
MSSKKGKKDKGGSESKKQEKAKLSVFLEEDIGMKTIANMKAITPQELARNAGVKISVANAFIKSLESKGIVKCVGGYSGHKVYQLVKS